MTGASRASVRQPLARANFRTQFATTGRAVLHRSSRSCEQGLKPAAELPIAYTMERRHRIQRATGIAILATLSSITAHAESSLAASGRAPVATAHLDFRITVLPSLSVRLDAGAPTAQLSGGVLAMTQGQSTRWQAPTRRSVPAHWSAALSDSALDAGAVTLSAP
jgi:hypothetical protein